MVEVLISTDLRSSAAIPHDGSLLEEAVEEDDQEAGVKLVATASRRREGIGRVNEEQQRDKEFQNSIPSDAQRVMTDAAEQSELQKPGDEKATNEARQITVLKNTRRGLGRQIVLLHIFCVYLYYNWIQDFVYRILYACT